MHQAACLNDIDVDVAFASNGFHSTPAVLVLWSTITTAVAALSLTHTFFLVRSLSYVLCPSVSLFLSMVVSKALVSRNGGSMSIFSAGNGQGTTVTLKFPVYRWAVE